MDNDLNLFERFLYEAPDDDPPDSTITDPPGDIPPDAPLDDSLNTSDPPDLSDDSSGDNVSGDPPDIGEDSGMDDIGGTDDFSGEDSSEDNNKEPINVSTKISSILNMNLYQRFLSLLNNIGSQLTLIKNNGDILYTISPESSEIVDNLKKLDENIRLYLKNNFINEDFSKNQLFFNKCINLLKLYNDIFSSDMKKGMKKLDS